MCGIAGVAYADPTHPVDAAALTRMRDAMTHRGPDDAGCHIAPGIGLASRRLAILDLSTLGHMPMGTADGRFWIAYNGEIYNYRELRSPLEARGYRFRSNTDTEVLLNLFVADGPAMLDKLNGMFAFAIWDDHERRLFIARDRLGIKPLFYSVANGVLRFASEPKALFAAGVPAEFEHDVWSELLCFRYVAGEGTAFKGIRRLLPGHYMTWQRGQMQVRRWWNLAERARALRETPVRDPVAWYRDTFDDAVRLRQISDVPIGVLLSGGLDSSTVAVSLAKQSASPVASFTVGFEEARYDETPLAQMVAQQYQLDAHRIQVDRSNILADLRQACCYNDEPLAHANDAHLLAISRYAKPRVTVLLSGEGADETLGGYVRYRPLRYPNTLRLGKPFIRGLAATKMAPARLRKLSALLGLGRLNRMIVYNACDTLPTDLEQLGLRDIVPPVYREQVVAEAETLYPGDFMRQAMYSDQHTFLCSVLDRNDRMTMGASIECRVPFLDYRLVEGVAALPTKTLLSGQGNKPLLRRSLGDRLPERILRHPKWGFGVPWRTYFRTVPELRSKIDDLANSDLIQGAPFDRRLLQSCVQEFWRGDDRNHQLLFQLLVATLAWDTVRRDTSLRPAASA